MLKVYRYPYLAKIYESWEQEYWDTNTKFIWIKMTFLRNTIACDNFAAYVEIILSQMIVERGTIQREMTSFGL